jgi:hypothetical protein
MSGVVAMSSRVRILINTTHINLVNTGMSSQLANALFLMYLRGLYDTYQISAAEFSFYAKNFC